MADPLSFIASPIAFGTLTVQVSTLVKHAPHHSDEVLALEDELEELKALANSSRLYVESNGRTSIGPVSTKQSKY